MTRQSIAETGGIPAEPSAAMRRQRAARRRERNAGKDYCTQNKGHCETCSLVSYRRDCENYPIDDQGGGLNPEPGEEVTTKTLYHEILIQPSSSGFGEYWTLPDCGEAYDSPGDLLAAIRENVGDVYELGVDLLPEILPDIRGKIASEPPRVFGWLDNAGGAHFFGVVGLIHNFE